MSSGKETIHGDWDLVGNLNVSGSISSGGSEQDWKDNVETVATANVTLSGEQTINGVLTSTSRIGVVGQSAPAENGIYVTAAGAWSRATDADEDAEVTNGLAFVVSGAGSTKVEFRYILTTADPITIGVTDLTFAEHPPGLVDVGDDTTPQLGGPLDTFGQSVNWSEGTPVASAATTDIWTTDGNTLHITGTTTITSFDTAPRVGAWRRVIFDDVLILTDGANLNLPGGANITTVADDMAFVYAETTTLFKVLYFRADGTPIAGAGIANVVEDTTPQYGGIMDTNQFQHRLSKGADIASAATLTPGTDGNYFDVTGTTTITAIADLAVGTVIRLHFDAVLILTHSATDLVLPTAANITTVAGDEATFVQFAAGDWRCTEYQRADGTALAGSAGAGDSIVTSINQTAHGFSVEEWVRHNGTLYVLSIADTAANAEVYGVITEITDVDNFVITTGGRATLSGLTAGLPHFLSDSVAGALTTTEPAISKPLFFADSTTTGFVINMRGFQSGLGGGSGTWEITETNSITSSTATADFTLDSSSKLWRLSTIGLLPTSEPGGLEFVARVKVGGSVQSGAVYEDVVERSTSSYEGIGNTSRNEMVWLSQVGGSTDDATTFAAYISNPGSTTDDKLFWGNGAYIQTGGGLRKNTFSSRFKSPNAIDGLRLFFSATNILKAEFVLEKMVGF